MVPRLRPNNALQATSLACGPRLNAIRQADTIRTTSLTPQQVRALAKVVREEFK
jgi:hypothetical protein